MADKRTNWLLIRDDARHLPALKAWAQEMDLPVGQVELAAHIVSMSETSLRELGVKWRLAEAGSPPGSGQITTLSSDVSVNDASTRAGFNVGKINGRLLELELSALERKQQVEIIASPRLLASHMQPASIKQGSEIPIRFPVAKAAPLRWSSKRRCWAWRSRRRCCSREECGLSCE